MTKIWFLILKDFSWRKGRIPDLGFTGGTGIRVKFSETLFVIESWVVNNELSYTFLERFQFLNLSV